MNWTRLFSSGNPVYTDCIIRPRVHQPDFAHRDLPCSEHGCNPPVIRGVVSPHWWQRGQIGFGHRHHRAHRVDARVDSRVGYACVGLVTAQQIGTRLSETSRVLPESQNTKLKGDCPHLVVILRNHRVLDLFDYSKATECAHFGLLQRMEMHTSPTAPVVMSTRHHQCVI